jgi:hypothetical protein
MDSQAAVRRVNAVFCRLHRNDAERLENGIRKREQLVKDIEAGKDPENERTEWIADTALALLETLKERALQFDEKYLDDMISVRDFGDAIATLTGFLQLEIDDEEDEG